MSTILALADRARGVEFDSGYSSRFTLYVRQGISKVFRSTSLTRGEFGISATTAAGSVTLLGVPATMLGGRISALIHLDNGEPLTEVNWIDLNALLAALGTGRGRPMYYTVGPQNTITSEVPNIAVYPTPDKVYNILVAGSQAPQTDQLDDADTAPIPEAYEEAIVAYARREAFAFIEPDQEMWTLHDNIWREGRSEIASDLQRRSTNNRRVPGTWAGMGSAGPTFHYKGLF